MTHSFPEYSSKTSWINFSYQIKLTLSFSVINLHSSQSVVITEVYTPPRLSVPRCIPVSMGTFEGVFTVMSNTVNSFVRCSILVVSRILGCIFVECNIWTCLQIRIKLAIRTILCLNNCNPPPPPTDTGLWFFIAANAKCHPFFRSPARDVILETICNYDVFFEYTGS